MAEDLFHNAVKPVLQYLDETTAYDRPTLAAYLTMPFTYQTHPGLPPKPLLGALLNLLTDVFANQSRDEWLADLVQKATYLGLQTLLALDGERVVGCKIGYAWPDSPDTFYSWLGGVSGTYRGRGIAGELMRRQHEAAQAAGYVVIRTHTYNQWRDMLILNLRYGFTITGTQPGKRGLTIVLEKRLISRSVS